MRILAGDVGGTKTALALYERGPDAFRAVRAVRYESAAHPGLAPIVRDFLRGGGVTQIDAAAFGVAGPVVDGMCRATNLPWVLSTAELTDEIGAPAALLNDFEAVALGLGELSSDELHVLQDRPADQDAPAAVLGAGTGLGEAILLPSAGRLPRVIATEGGHTDFAPRDEVEITLLRYLLQRHARVSIERVVSGPGLATLYDFAIEEGLAPRNRAFETRLASAPDRSALIGDAAVNGTDPASSFAVARFLSLYGAEAGNLALKTLPFGGLYVAGGIAPKLAPLLPQSDFLRSYRAKGRMEVVLDRIPLRVVMNPDVGLLGARRLAATLIG